jgi:hypothetical protein
MTPKVAMSTAKSLRGSQSRLKSCTVMMYAKKALVFQIAVISLRLS